MYLPFLSFHHTDMAQAARILKTKTCLFYVATIMACVSKKNAVARAELTFQMLTLL